jgi:hypothetical protein
MAKVGSVSPSEIRFALAEGRIVRYTLLDGSAECSAFVMNCEHAVFPDYRSDLFVLVHPNNNPNRNPPTERFLSEVRAYGRPVELPFWWLYDVSFSATKHPGTWHPIEYVPEIVLWSAEVPTFPLWEKPKEDEGSDIEEVSITLTFPNTDFDLVTLENALQWARTKADEEKFRRDRGAKDALHVLHILHERAMKATGHPEWVQPSPKEDQNE